MGRGGARIRSGPPADPLSARSEKRKYLLEALPVEGYGGVVPDFPIEPTESEAQTLREWELWEDAWRTPQACAWSMEPWRHRIIAQYCRVAAVVELNPGSSAALVAQVHRFRDQLGLTPGGLRENGWKIADQKVEMRVAGEVVAAPTQPRRSRSMA